MAKQKKSKRFTIFGNPVEHSKSPQMHNAGFKAIGFNAYYEKYHLIDSTKIKEVFLKNNFSGANITVPHKEDAFKQADIIEGLAQKIGAVNTYIKQDNKVIAYNTDAPGFMKAIEEFGKIKTALILGAGGTAKAIAVAFKEVGIKTTILNRSANRLEFFNNLGCLTYSWEDFSCDKYDLVVNSTSAGLKDDNYPTPKDMINNILENSIYAIDCIYGKMTPFLQLAFDKNIKCKDGEDMLLFQGVLAFELFTGIKADKHLIEAMRKGLKSS